MPLSFYLTVYSSLELETFLPHSLHNISTKLCIGTKYLTYNISFPMIVYKHLLLHRLNCQSQLSVKSTQTIVVLYLYISYHHTILFANSIQLPHSNTLNHHIHNIHTNNLNVTFAPVVRRFGSSRERWRGICIQFCLPTSESDCAAASSAIVAPPFAITLDGY